MPACPLACASDDEAWLGFSSPMLPDVAPRDLKNSSSFGKQRGVLGTLMMAPVKARTEEQERTRGWGRAAHPGGYASARSLLLSRPLPQPLCTSVSPKLLALNCQNWKGLGPWPAALRPPAVRISGCSCCVRGAVRAGHCSGDTCSSCVPWMELGQEAGLG